MPGQTNNTDLLAGLNELISSVNELITVTSSQKLSTRVSLSSGCGCPPISDTPPVWEDVGVNDDPPEGWTAVEGGPVTINTRKCKMANYQITQLQWGVEQLVIAGVETYAGVYISTVISMIVLVFSAPAAPAIMAAMVGVFGWINGVVESLLTNVVDLDALQTALETYEEELVCALYEALSTDEARSNVDDVLSTGGVSAGNRAVIQAMYTIDWAGQLFFEYDEYIEQELDGFTPTYDCTSCEQTGCQLCIAVNSDESSNGIYIELSDTQISYSSGLVSTTHWAICEFNSDPINGWCGPEVEVNNMTTEGMTPWETSAYRVYDENLSLVWNSSSPPNWATIGKNVRRIQFKSHTAFSGVITLESA